MVLSTRRAGLKLASGKKIAPDLTSRRALSVGTMGCTVHPPTRKYAIGPLLHCQADIRFNTWVPLPMIRHHAGCDSPHSQPEDQVVGTGTLPSSFSLNYSQSYMGTIYETIDADLAAWIENQHMFFIATAPGTDGHVNCSPKGLDTFRILGPRAVAYLDLTGSGVETIAHLQENGRIVLMFCAFQGPPKIVRLYGRGSSIPVRHPRFAELIEHFSLLEPSILAAARSVICVEVERIADSCGHGVPLMRYEGDRSQIPAWADNRLRKQGADALVQYQAEKNLTSIDSLPGLDTALLDISNTPVDRP
jgi:Pyridoxamine 5'-phosphate oxidase